MRTMKPRKAVHLSQILLRATALGALLTASACVSNGDDEFFDAGTTNIPLEGLCVDGCNLLEQCGQCDTDPVGECYDRVQCIEVCDQQGSYDRFACLIGTGAGNACGADFDGCISGSAVTGCHQACGVLEECNLCVTNAAGACLTVQGCLDRCDSQDQAAGFQCVLDLQACDANAVEACFSNNPPDLGNDDCARGCAALDACELCLPDANGDCESPEACVATCRGVGDTLDAGRAACVAAVQGCDEDAINTCLNAEVPLGDDDCAKGCAALDACDLCVPDANGDCLTPLQCATGCRAGDPIDATVAICLENLNNCDAAAIDACFSAEPPPPAPDCAVYCQRVVECAAPPAEEQAAALAACTDQCTTVDDPALRTCFVEAADCATAAACEAANP